MATVSPGRVIAAVLLVVLAGCGDDTDAGSPTPDEETSMTPSEVQGRIDAAVADLAAREDVDEADVTVAEYGAVTWSDSSLGCPKPGMSYLQALTDGFLLVLEIDGRQFEYHGGAVGGLRYCADPKPPAEWAK